MEPMLLKPVGKDYLWGGTRLKSEYGKKIDLTPLAETWECSTHPDGLSIVQNGQYAGMTLDVVLTERPEYLGKRMASQKELPILVKFIDADKNLSVQVHPDDDYARQYENAKGKTEMWYVLDAKPGASLIYGFEHPMSKELLEKAVLSGHLSKHLQKVLVQKDDVFFIPAGTVHAIGEGILLAEIQENSNVTYRVFDYNRVDKNGKKRELHFAKAVDVMDMSAEKMLRKRTRVVRCFPGCSRELLCQCEYFEVERIQMIKDFSFFVLGTSFQVLLCLEGKGYIKSYGNENLKFGKGDCIFLPAGMGKCDVFGTSKMLKVRC